MQCPVCDHEASVSEFGDPAKCPACGVYYDKALSNQRRLENASSNAREKSGPEPVADNLKYKANAEHPIGGEVSKVKFSDWLNSNPHMKVVGALVFGLVVGYFVGREHVKYEIQSALQNSFKGLAGAFSGARVAEPVKLAQKAKAPSVVSAAFIRKDYSEGEYGQGTIDIVLDFKNDSQEDIRAFDGVLHFTDLLGNAIIDSNVAVNETVQAGKILSWKGAIKYNKFIDRHKNFRFAEDGNIKLSFDLKKVLYADGRLQEY
ncbi:hypothetical protein [Pseudomonas sp. EA_35y_Pfl2_R111]|uniref:hypothetical protein n=1 Tax=Pseudomonas sp. EA_35y_Pfl2_R111 TaxID=3088689 RepID=UPI0030DBAF55